MQSPLLNGKLVPLVIIRGIGSSAREVGPAALFLVRLLVLPNTRTPLSGPIASPGDACPGSDGAIQHGGQLKTKPGKYGIISLFDGVSSVSQGCSPKSLVVPQRPYCLRRMMSQYDDWFAPNLEYRTDEKWGYTMSGSACLYISDVHKLAENDCFLLRQLAAQFPGLKWFIIGGSPCQDLTYAGYLHGLLGLVGARSRLFFLLLLTIRTIQILVGISSVRFLVENAGSQ